MRTRDDIEAYLSGSGYRHDEVGEGTWVVEDAGSPGARVVVRLEEDLVIFRLAVMPVSEVKQKEGMFQALLTLNASDMVHGSYGIDDDLIVMSCVLRLDDLDLSEFRGTIDDFLLALARHRDELAKYR